MSSISLAEPTAQRLYFDGRDWHLELEAWRPVDRDVFAPQKTVLQGSESILSALADLGALKELVVRAKAHLQEQPSQRLSFAIKDGQFVAEPYPSPSLLPEPNEARSSAVPPAVQRSLADLKSELEALRHQVQDLEALIAKFEPLSSPTSNENALSHEEATFDAV